MTAGTRRVRVVVEGMAHGVSDKCGVLRIDLPADENGVPVVMVNPEWEGVTVEDVAPSYNWQDGDAVQGIYANGVWYRDGGMWRLEGGGGRTDGWVTERVKGNTMRVLRYQAGAA